MKEIAYYVYVILVFFMLCAATIPAVRDWWRVDTDAVKMEVGFSLAALWLIWIAMAAGGPPI